ncbi:MAG: hypothetical protein WCQ26_06065 [Pseudanabaena sp. ELA748]
MIKVAIAACILCLGIGSTLGYLISENERRYAMQALKIEAANTKPVQQPLTRKELETRFIACIGRSVKLDRFADKDLNDDLAECEAARKTDSK